MRIISGKYKGRRIEPGSSVRARPTTDFARESLFNILGNRVDFNLLSVLDLFAGTGSISYEFASRGAAEVHLVERDMKHIASIKRIIYDMDIGNIKVIHIDVRAFLKTCSHKYDIVFADPPYDLPWLKELPDLVTGAELLKEGGFFILEHPGKISFTSHKLFFEHRKYGSVNFSFFKGISV